MDDPIEAPPISPQEPAQAAVNDTRAQVARDIKLIGHALREQETRIRSTQAVTLVLLVATLVVILELELIRRSSQ